MKKKVFLLLFLAVTSLVYSQHNNNNLHETFDSEAFEIRVPDTWKVINPSYPYFWVKEFRYKDSTLNSYFNVGQYKIVKLKKKNLKKIVNTRVKELKRVPYKKFNYSIEKKNPNHLILKTSWQNWRDKKSLVKHTTEFLIVRKELYVFKYSDSTKTSLNFKTDVSKMISSFKKKKDFKKDPYIRIFSKPKFQVKFLSNWDVTKIKGKNWLNSLIFYKKAKYGGAVSYIESPVFTIESDYYIIKEDLSLIQLELIILKMDKSLRGNENLKSRITEKFIEITGVWKDYKRNKRKKTIRYFKHNNSIFKVVYDANLREYDDYLKEKKLFFGSLKFN